LVGDAAAFLDPLYSPGMDWISFTASRAADLITTERSGGPIEGRITRHNYDFAESYRCWFEAIFKDKYEYLGEFDLMSVAFTLDLGFYYLGIVSQPFKLGRKAFLVPPFSDSISRPFFQIIRTYNRRFASIARRRRRMNRLGRCNRSRRFLIPGFTLEPTDASLLLKALGKWLWLEAREGWHSWGETAEREGDEVRSPAPGQRACAVVNQ
jgi:hypothetical protein